MPRRILEGNVVSDKADKTVTVLVERRFKHPVYKKYIRKTDKYTAHDELNTYKEGDRVQIIECRPLSRKKRWAVLTNGEAIVPPVGKAAAAPAAKKPAPAKKEKAEKKQEAAPKKAAAKKPAAKKTTAKKDA